MSQTITMKKNMINLDLNQGWLVHSVTYLVGCCVVWDYLYVSRFLATVAYHVMMMEVQLIHR